MAKFKLYLLNLTNLNEDMIQFTPSIISEFYSPDVVQKHSQTQESSFDNDDNSYYYEKSFDNNYNSYCYTFNESLSVHTNAQKELSFKMEKMILKDSEWIENPYTKMMLPGTQLCLIDMYDNQYLFTIESVKYEFKETNIIYTITCKDSFSQQLSTQNDGYEIVNNSSKSTFIGAKDIDFWASKIVQDCYIPYIYVPLNQGLYLTENGLQNNKTGEILKTYKLPYSQQDYPEYYDLIPFSASGSANSILIELANKIDFMINVCEYSVDGQHKFQRYFWLEPKKHEDTSGLLYSPYDSIKSLGLTHNGKSLTTILNVIGANNNSKIVSLLPNVPEYFLQLFNSSEWDSLQYEPNIYTQIINHKLQTYTNLQHTDFRIWHGAYQEDFINETYKNISPQSLNLDKINQSLDYNVYKKDTYLYLPVVTNDDKSFYIPGYDFYDFNWDNKNSFIKIQYSGTEKTLDNIDNTFQLCNIKDQTIYKYLIDDTIPAPDASGTLINLDCYILNANDELVPNHIELTYNPSVGHPLSVSDSVTKSYESSPLLVSFDVEDNNTTLDPKINVTLRDYSKDITLSSSAMSSTQVQLGFKYHSSITHDSMSIPGGGGTLYKTITTYYAGVYVYENGTARFLFNTPTWYTTTARQVGDGASGDYPSPSYPSIGITINGSYISVYKMSYTTQGQTSELARQLNDTYIIPDPRAFFLKREITIPYCGRESSGDQSILQEVILSEENLASYKYTTVFPDNNNNFMFLKIFFEEPVPNSFDITQENIYLNWLRTPTKEESDFAKIADEIPWLENKLIDFTYFYERDIINKQQYSELQNCINNELRLVNGKLIFYTNAYYNALHYQTTEMANLLNSLESLGAIFNNNVINTYANNGAISNIMQFDNAYKTIFCASNFLTNKHELLNFDNIYSDYINKYISAQQRFLKNIYYFQQYFNENISIFRPNSAVCEDIITITNKSDSPYYYSFNKNNNWLKVSLNFNLYNFQEKPNVPIYLRQDGIYSQVEIVDASNYQSYDYAQIEVDNNYNLIEEQEDFNLNNTFFKIWEVDPYYYNTIQEHLDNFWIKEEATDDIATKISNKTYRYWKTILIQGKWYVYPVAPWPEDVCESTLYNLSDGTITIGTTGNFTYINVQQSWLQEAYTWFYSLKREKKDHFDDYNNRYTLPVLEDWYIREPELYSEVDQLFFRGHANDAAITKKIWTYDSTDGWTFNNPWCISNFWSYGLWKELFNLLTKSELYIKNLPLSNLYIKTHQYKIQDSCITIVNKKQQSFSEWFSSFKYPNEDITLERWNKDDNPYNYYIYQEIPFVNYNNYKNFSHKNFPKYSWWQKAQPGVIKNLGFVLGMPLNALGYTIASSIPTNPDAFYDNAHYSDGQDFANPGAIIYSTELTESLKAPEIQQPEDLYESNGDWVVDTCTHDRNPLDFQNLTPEDLDTWAIKTIDFSSPGSIEWEPNCNYISFYKFFHHTFGTLLEYYRRGYQYLDGNHTDLPAQQLLFKDTRCILLEPEDILNTTDTYCIIPIGLTSGWVENADDPNCCNYFVRWRLNDSNHSVDFKNYFDNICYSTYDNKKYFSKISCYPWMNSVRKISIDSLQSVNDFLTENYVYNMVDGVDVPCYKIKFPQESQMEYYCVVIREEDYSHEDLSLINDNQYTYYYNKSTDQRIEWDKVQNIFFGCYYHENKDADFTSAQQLEKFDNTKHYYNPADHQKRIYTIQQIKQQNDYYYLADNTYKEVNINADKTSFTNLELYQYKKTYDDYQNIVSLDLEDTIKINVDVPSSYQKLEGFTIDYPEYTIEVKTEIKQPLSNITNGQFWYLYHGETEYPILFEYAAAIETKLQEYWSVAYNASLFCEYFIPSSWQPSLKGARNYFVDQLYTITADSISLTKVLPQVSIFKNSDGSTECVQYLFHYSSSGILKNVNAINVIKDIPTLKNLDLLFGKDFWNNISAEEIGTTTYFQATGGWIKPNILLTKDLVSYNKFGGIYQMIIVYLQEHYIDKPIDNYLLYQDKHNQIWKRLYQKYPSILIENKYENTDATTSMDLMTMAKYAFKDLSRPEKEYNISMINNLKDFIDYQGQELRIGDPIQLASREFYDQFDDIRVSLDQLLFISDIKYNLREDNNVSITVNSIKYQDKLIQRLVKLIK